jgi:DNA-binding MarR family transcriptional regulator
VLEVADRLHERVAKALAPAGLSYEAYRVLVHLGRSKDALDVGGLASACQGGGSTVTEILAGLETEGLVRVVAGGQGRGTRAQLTELGLARACDASKRLHRTAAEFASVLDASERASLGRLFGRVLGDEPGPVSPRAPSPPRRSEFARAPGARRPATR